MAHVIVYVKWLDHCTHNGWVDAAAIKDGDLLKTFESVGWLVRETDDAIALSTSFNSVDGDCADPLCIAKRLILERRTIRESKPRASKKKPQESSNG